MARNSLSNLPSTEQPTTNMAKRAYLYHLMMSTMAFILVPTFAQNCSTSQQSTIDSFDLADLNTCLDAGSCDSSCIDVYGGSISVLPNCTSSDNINWYQSSCEVQSACTSTGSTAGTCSTTDQTTVNNYKLTDLESCVTRSSCDSSCRDMYNAAVKKLPDCTSIDKSNWYRDALETERSCSNTSSKGGSKLTIIVGVCVGVVIVLLLATLMIIVYRRHRDGPNKEASESDRTSNIEYSPGYGPPIKTPKSDPPNGLDLLNDGVCLFGQDEVNLGSVIGTGAFGAVYKAELNLKGKSSRCVAVKMLCSADYKDKKKLFMFLDEVNRVAAFKHSRIVDFIGVTANAENNLCMVMEFMHRDLTGLLAHYKSSDYPNGFSRDKVLIALHVAEALVYLHANGIIHRDLKSSNILLNDQLHAKVSDFGISRAMASTMTMGAGTLWWMSPEVLREESYDSKADIYSFGVVLAELDSLGAPKLGGYDSETSGNISQTEATYLLGQGRACVQFVSDPSNEIVALGKECLRYNPKDRPTAATLVSRLEALYAADGQQLR